jgi:hypothetical protein
VLHCRRRAPLLSLGANTNLHSRVVASTPLSAMWKSKWRRKTEPSRSKTEELYARLTDRWIDI